MAKYGKEKPIVSNKLSQKTKDIRDELPKYLWLQKLNIRRANPLDEEEKAGLKINTITTSEELDEFEQLTIQKAVEWTLKNRWSANKIFSEDFILALHAKMYGDVWTQAGTFRKSNKNIGGTLLPDTNRSQVTT